jgi:D-lyxose ketol-isomerase
MKRSEINAVIKETIGLFDEYKFKLPPFAGWTPDQWQSKGDEADEIRDCMLGWDVTDFASGDFGKLGLTLFTVRNGRLDDGNYPKTYAEKLMVVDEEQVTPMHFHWKKTEDIINRGGGDLLIELYNATDDDKLADSKIRVSIDGVSHSLKAGSIVTLTPGESICLTPRLFHKFWGGKGKGKVIVGEVSAVNDDNTDNCFLDSLPRFPGIDEDEPPFRLLCWEYPES